MRAILIDPMTETVTEINYDGNYESIYRLIDCDLFTVVYLQNEDCLFVDDEGLLKDPKYFFNWQGYPQPLAGKGLILGPDDEENEKPKDCQYSLEEAKNQITFTKLSVEGFMTTEGKTKVLGQEGFYIRQTPVFGPPKGESDE